MNFLARFFRLLRLALWRAFEHDAFGVAKGGAFSSVLTLFPALMLSTSIVAAFAENDVVQQISQAVSTFMPPGTAGAAQVYFQQSANRPIPLLIAASLITLWTASGVMISWMEGFRNAYRLPKTWGVIKERLISFGLVILAGLPLSFATLLLAFGNQIELRIAYNMTLQLGHSVGPYILFLWTLVRWLIAALTSIAVMALIYHHAVPRTQRWHSVLAGAALATGLWFPATVGFGWYVRHSGQYSLFYGSLAASIVLLVWMYIVSLIVLLGAEFNALIYPRLLAAQEEVVSDPRLSVR